MLRLEYPDASLGELGKRLTHPITKSTVAYRWHKLQAMLDTNKNDKLPQPKTQTML